MTEYWKDTTTPQFEGEIWKDIPGYEGLYQCSSLGRVKSLDRLVRYMRKGVILKQRLHTYLYVGLGTNKYFTVHSLVMLSFVGARPKEFEIDHINTIRTDNRLENLRYCTKEENRNNPITRKRNRKKLLRMIENNKKPVLQYDLNGNFIRKYDSIRSARTNLGEWANIVLCCQGKLKTTYGFQWRYYNPKKPIIENIPPINPGSKRIILQLDFQGNIIKKWESISEAVKYLGLCGCTHISACCKGQRNSAGGFKWSYA